MGRIMKKLHLISLENDYNYLKDNAIVTILDDDMYSRIYRRLFGVEKWMSWVSMKLTKAEYYLYEIKRLGGNAEHYDRDMRR